MSVYIVIAGPASRSDLALAASLIEPAAEFRHGKLTHWHGTEYVAWIATASRHAKRVPPKPRKRKVIES